jgi:Protein of unknown function DUF47
VAKIRLRLRCSLKLARTFSAPRGLLDQMLRTFPDSGPLAAEIRDCEQQGDQLTHGLIDRMNKPFVTPIEGEDVLQLASALDDVVDYIEEVADFLGLYAIGAPMDQTQQLAEIIVRATRELAVALPMLQGFKDIQAQVLEVDAPGIRLGMPANRLRRRKGPRSGRPAPVDPYQPPATGLHVQKPTGRERGVDLLHE